jgi:hypothetical protein
VSCSVVLGLFADNLGAAILCAWMAVATTLRGFRLLPAVHPTCHCCGSVVATASGQEASWHSSDRPDAATLAIWVPLRQRRSTYLRASYQRSGFGNVELALSCPLLLDHRQAGVIPQKCGSVRIADHTPETAKSVRLELGNAVWSVTVSLNAQQRLTEWTNPAGAHSPDPFEPPRSPAPTSQPAQRLEEGETSRRIGPDWMHQ